MSSKTNERHVNATGATSDREIATEPEELKYPDVLRVRFPKGDGGFQPVGSIQVYINGRWGRLDEISPEEFESVLKPPQPRKVLFE